MASGPSVRPPGGSRRRDDKLAFGVDELDARLADGGVASGALHEFAAGSSTLADDAAALLFVAGIAARAARFAPVLWVTSRVDLYAPEMHEAGMDPTRVVIAQMKDDREAVGVMEEALLRGSFGAVVGEVRRVELAATRRLQFAAEVGHAPALLLRRHRKRWSCPLDAPSMASTRWRIACAVPTRAGAANPGRPQWIVNLVRQRGGDPFSLTLAACDARGRFASSCAEAFEE